MDSIVTARVPVEIKEQGNEVLARMGSTPTQLVNSAYEYVLRHGELPAGKNEHQTRVSEHKVLSQDRARKIHTVLRKSSFSVSETYWNGKTYKELIAEGKKADYEALA